MIALMGRNRKEILRDPLTLIFGLVLPILLLVMMSVVNSAVPIEIWQFMPENFVPAMGVFSMSFMTLFTGLLVSKDRQSSFLTRIFASPLKAWQYVLAYVLPMMAVAALQSAVCLLAGLCFGLKFTWHLAACLLAMLPAALFYVALGMLLGTVLNDKQVGGIAGGALVSLSGLIGGIWFDLRMFPQAAQTVLKVLPFASVIDTARAACAGDWAGMVVPLLIGLAWALAVFGFAMYVFGKRMRSGKAMA